MSYTRNITSDFNVYKDLTEEELKKKIEVSTQSYNEWRKQRASQFFYAVKPSDDKWGSCAAIPDQDSDAVDTAAIRPGCNIT